MMNPAEFANIAKAEQDFWWYRGMREITLRMLDPVVAERRPRQVLEAGCGTGHFARVLRDRYNFPVTAIDLGWEGIRYGREYGLDRLAQADIAALPFGSQRFDLVVSMDVIVHFQRGEEDRAMSELARVLSRNGTLIIRVSALDLLRSRHSQFAHERQRFTRGRLEGLALRHGIRVERCTYVNSLLLPVAFAKFRVWEPLTRAEPESGVQPVAPWLDRLLYSSLALESEVIAKGGSFPLGQSLIMIGRK
jgi:SAM-dependent methyltransferase